MIDRRAESNPCRDAVAGNLMTSSGYWARIRLVKRARSIGSNVVGRGKRERRRAQVLLSVAALISLLGGNLYAQQWGDLTGRFVFDGKPPAAAKLTVTKDLEVCGKMPLFDQSLVVDENGGIANVVIYVTSKKVKVHPDLVEAPSEPVVFDNEDCQFVPHVAIIRVGQPLTLKNSDAVAHNSNMQPLGDVGINPLIGAGKSTRYQFSRAQTRPVPVGCNVHPWMRGYILPRDNPYMAVSAADGTFKIEKLPVGKIEFHVWHERPGYVNTKKWKKGKFELTIKAGENKLPEVKLSENVLSRK